MICLVVLWPIRSSLIDQTRVSLRVYRFLKASPPQRDGNQQFIGLIEHLTPQQQYELDVFERRKMVPTMLNVPSLLVQLPYVILNPDKKEWVPKSMDLWTWRAIALPLIGILFWWIAGRGMEALLAARPQLVRPRIRWIEVVVGATLLLFCVFAAVGLPLYYGHKGDSVLTLIVAGMVMWALLGATLVSARLVEWRVTKRTSAIRATRLASPQGHLAPPPFREHFPLYF